MKPKFKERNTSTTTSKFQSSNFFKRSSETLMHVDSINFSEAMNQKADDTCVINDQTQEESVSDKKSSEKKTSDDSSKVREKKKKSEYCVSHFDRYHPIFRGPQPDPTEKKKKPLVEKTNLKLRKQLQEEIFSKFPDRKRLCQCRSSSTKIYNAAKQQVKHMFGKQAASHAMRYDDYFNTKNINKDPLPSFSDLLEVSRKNYPLQLTFD